MGERDKWLLDEWFERWRRKCDELKNERFEFVWVWVVRGGRKKGRRTLTGSLRDVFLGGVPGVWPFALWLQIGYENTRRKTEDCQFCLCFG